MIAYIKIAVYSNQWHKGILKTLLFSKTSGLFVAFSRTKMHFLSISRFYSKFSFRLIGTHFTQFLFRSYFFLYCPSVYFLLIFFILFLTSRVACMCVRVVLLWASKTNIYILLLYHHLITPFFRHIQVHIRSMAICNDKIASFLRPKRNILLHIQPHKRNRVK